MPNDYAIRITYPYETLSVLLGFWAEKCEKVAVYEHVGERTNKTHCHLVIVGCTVTKDQLKNYAKQQTSYSLKGNGASSFKVYDGNERACVYMAKGTLDPKLLKGWTQEDAARWKSLWVGDKGHQPRKETLLYDDCFDDMMYETAWLYHQRDHPPLYDMTKNDYQFCFVKQWAHKYAFDKFGRVWNIQAINMYKMLVYTYIFRNNLKIPETEKIFLRF